MQLEPNRTEPAMPCDAMRNAGAGNPPVEFTSSSLTPRIGFGHQETTPPPENDSAATATDEDVQLAVREALQRQAAEIEEVRVRERSIVAVALDSRSLPLLLLSCLFFF